MVARFDRQRVRAGRSLPKLTIGGLILGLHLVLLASFDRLASQRVELASTPTEFYAIAQLIVQSPKWDRVPAPEVEMESVPIDVNGPRLVQFDDSEDESLSGVVGPASAPRLSRFQSADVGDFARRAAILPGHPMTVVLSVQVSADGGASAVDIVRSCGLAAADRSAIDYALLLHWIPGTVDHAPRSMRVILPVTLVAPARS
jgi:TonB family protein